MTATSTTVLTGPRLECFRLLSTAARDRDACLQRLDGCEAQATLLDTSAAIQAATPVPPIPVDPGFSVPVWIAILAGAAIFGAGVALDRLLPRE